VSIWIAMIPFFVMMPVIGIMIGVRMRKDQKAKGIGMARSNGRLGL